MIVGPRLAKGGTSRRELRAFAGRSCGPLGLKKAEIQNYKIGPRLAKGGTTRTCGTGVAGLRRPQAAARRRFATNDTHKPQPPHPLRKHEKGLRIGRSPSLFNIS